MNINKLRAEIEQIRQHLCINDEGCNCRYVEINDAETVSLEAQEIIKSNQRCMEHNRIQHIGYSKIIISKL